MAKKTAKAAEKTPAEQKAAAKTTAPKTPAPKTPAEPASTLAKVKKAVVGAAESVAEVATDVAASAQKHVVTPVAQAVGLVKKPKAKPVRTKTPAAKSPAAPLPPRSTSAAGKLMSKKLAVAPRDAAKGGKSRGKPQV